MLGSTPQDTQSLATKKHCDTKAKREDLSLSLSKPQQQKKNDVRTRVDLEKSWFKWYPIIAVFAFVIQREDYSLLSRLILQPPSVL